MCPLKFSSKITHLNTKRDSVIVDSLKLSGRGVVERAPSP